MANDDDRSPFSRRTGNDGGGGSTGPQKPRFAPWLIVPVLLLALLIFNQVLSNSARETISYSEFIDHVEQGTLDPDIPVKISDSSISGALKAQNPSRRRSRRTSRRRISRRS